MRALVLPGVAALALLAGCGPDAPQLTNQQMADAIENIAEETPTPDRGPALPALIEIRRDDVERELQRGAGCDFSEGGRLLFVAVAGDAFAKVNGSPVHLAASGPMGPTGGYFVNERFSISVGRLTESGVTVGETTTWPARIVLTDRRAEQNGVLRLEGSWRCGA
ncbi:MAG: hypothetical protein QOI38_1940 [Sphingomonadales bacterium]|jgi:hypothetical protein|nr:hypothetical protein [Sphingomonadales bacterium]